MADSVLDTVIGLSEGEFCTALIAQLLPLIHSGAPDADARVLDAIEQWVVNPDAAHAIRAASVLPDEMPSRPAPWLCQFVAWTASELPIAGVESQNLSDQLPQDLAPKPVVLKTTPRMRSGAMRAVVALLMADDPESVKAILKRIIS